ncbi:MAG: hypothetical protein IKO42_07250 [Opitutales bacterium]|nr:hypothetical protein [Opitutales bacterium]MBR6388848.1 hypothetical protein [Opitutales bacterium]
MKKLQTILISAALACSAVFANQPPYKEIPPADASKFDEAAPQDKEIQPAKKLQEDIIKKIHDEKFPKEVTENLSPLMKKVKDMVWGKFAITEINKNFFNIILAGNYGFIGENENSVLHIGFMCPIFENTRKYELYIANYFNMAYSLIERDGMYFKHFVIVSGNGEPNLVSIIKIRNSGEPYIEKEIKKHLETLEPYANEITTFMSLFNAGFDPTSDTPYEILGRIKEEKLPLKFLRIETHPDTQPLYRIVYESSPSTEHVKFMEYRNPTQSPRIDFDALKKDAKEKLANAKISEQTFANIKFQTINNDLTDITGAKIATSFYYAKNGGAEIYFEVSTPFPRTPEAQKIIDKMIEKRASAKMPLLPQAPAPEQEEKATQANVPE